MKTQLQTDHRSPERIAADREAALEFGRLLDDIKRVSAQKPPTIEEEIQAVWSELNG